MKPMVDAFLEAYGAVLGIEVTRREILEGSDHVQCSSFLIISHVDISIIKPLAQTFSLSSSLRFELPCPSSHISLQQIHQGLYGWMDGG